MKPLEVKLGILLTLITLRTQVQVTATLKSWPILMMLAEDLMLSPEVGGSLDPQTIMDTVNYHGMLRCTNMHHIPDYNHAYLINHMYALV